MSDRPCDLCRRPTPNFICFDCIRKATEDLNSVGWLVAELQTTLSKQARIAAPAARVKGTPEEALPFHLGASEAAWVLRNTLSTWARALCESRGVVYTGVDSSAGIARWLARNIMAIALWDEGAECVDELRAAIRNVRRCVDRPLGTVYIGPCGANGCPTDIYAPLHRATAQCLSCGAEIDVETRRRDLSGQVRGLLGTAAELSRMLPWILDTQITRKRITYYGVSGMVSVRRGLDGITLYPVGGVIDAHLRFLQRHPA